MQASESAVARVRHALETAERVEPSLNAFITLTPEHALAEAEAHDRAGPSGALAGMPVAVKDCIDATPFPTTCASRAFDGRVPVEDAASVRRLREHGAIVIGKTNMHELACAVAEHLPRANSPLAPELTAGGSSGGSAAAVGSGAAELALGTDGGGSSRIPAAFCGVVGFKPSFGRAPLDGVVSLAPTLDHLGFLAQTTAHARDAFHAVEGSRRTASATEDGAFVLAVPTLGGAVTPPVRAGLGALIARAAAAGARVESVELPSLRDWREPYLLIFHAEAAESTAEWDLTRAGRAARETLTVAVAAGEYREAQRFRTLLRAEVDAALEGRHALLMPTVDHLPWADDPAPADPAYWGELRWTAPFNLTGHPAISIPVERGVLAGSVQLVGDMGHDELLLDVAAWIEALTSTRRSG